MVSFLDMIMFLYTDETKSSNIFALIKQIVFVNYFSFMLRPINLTCKCINVNLVKRITCCIVVTFSLANYCHECDSLLESSIPTIDKFICRNVLLPDTMRI